MERTFEILKELFSRDLRTSTLETVIFLVVVFGFFGILVIANVMRRRKEKKRLSRLHREKWEELCAKYNLTEQEISFLEQAAQYLKSPEKKYLLLTDYQVFQNAMTELSEQEAADTELASSIIGKSGMTEHARKAPPVQIQRRKSARRTVNITAMLAPIEHRTAHVEARMFDLSAGGCKTENPDRRFKAGDDIKVTFKLQDKEYRDIPSEVVRTGAGARTLHISFGHVKRRTQA
ncbi:MAG: PilZ domain-containing protein [Spirochaetota bacterium]|nr:PilZ domain-containing protein [Spirochaetota bacterium]